MKEVAIFDSLKRRTDDDKDMFIVSILRVSAIEKTLWSLLGSKKTQPRLLAELINLYEQLRLEPQKLWKQKSDWELELSQLRSIYTTGILLLPPDDERASKMKKKREMQKHFSTTATTGNPYVTLKVLKVINGNSREDSL